MKCVDSRLEDIKIEQAFRSETMKLKYKEVNKPSEINILDYTIIAALGKQIAFTTNKHSDCETCAICYQVLDMHDNYCSNCGQRIEKINIK